MSPLFSVVIPCFNEAATIIDLLERVRSAPVASKQIIVVDDGSTDGTREILQGLRADDLTVLLHERNCGKGAALATGFAAARGEDLLDVFPDAIARLPFSEIDQWSD